MDASNRLGKYELESKIAVGGMAEIWLAKQVGPAGFAKTQVIKRILPNLAQDAKFVEMFLDEARIAANLEHPNIVRISDLGEADGSYYIAMEYIDGPDLDYVIERATQLDVLVSQTVAARIVADMLAGLDYAHHFQDSQGELLNLVHRDISPHNVLISANGVVKVCDFGVAKAATSRHKTQAGAVKGKFAYMSPEQIAAQPLDGRSDVFAAGIVLYELTTNQRPFGDEGELLAVTAILTQQPTDPREFVADFPADLEEIIMRALAKNRDERYADAREMQEALERFIQSQGQIVGAREVAEYIQDLFSARPSFWNRSEDPPPLAPRFDGADNEHWETSLTNTRNRPRTRTPSDAKKPPVDRPAAKPPVSPSPKPDPPQAKDPAPVPHDPPVSPGGSGGPNPMMLMGVAAGLLVLVLTLIGGGVWYVVNHGEGNTPEPAPEPEAIVTKDGGDEPPEPEPSTPIDNNPMPLGPVVIITTPSSTVFFHDEKKGVTPVNLRLPPGQQTVYLRNARKGISKEVTFFVKPGKVTEVSETFEFGFVRLKLPKGEKDVWLDNHKLEGDLSKRVPLNVGEHKLRLKRPSGKVIEKTVSIEESKEKTLTFP